MSKNFTFLFMLVAAFLFIGNGLLKAQTEVWNQAHAWNIDRYYRGVDYHPLNGRQPHPDSGCIHRTSGKNHLPGISIGSWRMGIRY
jgi:hypothetical protein